MAAKNHIAKLIVTMAVVGKQPLEYQCAVFDFSTYSFLDLVAELLLFWYSFSLLSLFDAFTYASGGG